MLNLTKVGDIKWMVHILLIWHHLGKVNISSVFLMDMEVNINVNYLILLGMEVAEFVKRHFVEELVKNSNYKKGKY